MPTVELVASCMYPEDFERRELRTTRVLTRHASSTWANGSQHLAGGGRAVSRGASEPPIDQLERRALQRTRVSFSTGEAA